MDDIDKRIKNLEITIATLKEYYGHEPSHQRMPYAIREVEETLEQLLEGKRVEEVVHVLSLIHI